MEKVLIAVPTFESVQPATFKSIYDLDTSGFDVCFEPITGYTVAHARNKIVERGFEVGADLVFMVDSDIVLSENALQLLYEDDVDVVSGVYMHRDPGNKDAVNTNLVKLGQFNYYEQVTRDEIHQFVEDGVQLLEVKGGGLGCCLISMPVFTAIEMPWFAWRSYQNGKMLSEDLHFCEKLKEAGITFHADPRVQCGHMFRFIEEV